MRALMQADFFKYGFKKGEPTGLDESVDTVLQRATLTKSVVSEGIKSLITIYFVWVDPEGNEGPYCNPEKDKAWIIVSCEDEGAETPLTLFTGIMPSIKVFIELHDLAEWDFLHSEAIEPE